MKHISNKYAVPTELKRDDLSHIYKHGESCGIMSNTTRVFDHAHAANGIHTRGTPKWRSYR